MVTIHRYKNTRMHILTKKLFSYFQCIIMHQHYTNGIIAKM